MEEETKQEKNHRRLFLIIVHTAIILSMAIILLMFFVVGKSSSETHEHHYLWLYDETYHWEEDEETKEIIMKSEHTLIYSINSDNQTHYESCDVCGYEEKLDHVFSESWSHDNYTHYHECVCGAKTDNEIHVLTAQYNSVSSHYEVCSICSYKSNEENHDLEWKYTLSGHYQECKDNCGYHTEMVSHDNLRYFNNNNGLTHYIVCDTCGYSDDITHTYSSAWSTNETSHYHECLYCGDKKDEDTHSNYYSYISDGETNHHQQCEVCEYSTSESEHELEYVSVGETSHYEKCKECNYQSKTTSHVITYVSDEDQGHHQECSLCSYESEIISHAHYTYNKIEGNTDEHRLTCVDCGYNTLGPHDWDNGEIIDNPTCTSTGSEKYTCLECEMEKEVTLGSANHIYEEDDWHYNDDKHYHVCDVCHQDVGDDTDHAWLKTETIVPTCLDEGYSIYTCSVCGDSKKDDEVNALGHYVSDTNNWNVNEEEHYHECERCGVRFDDDQHTYDNDTYLYGSENHYHTCDVCHYIVESTVSEHEYTSYISDGSTGHRPVCGICGFQDVAQDHILTYAINSDGETHRASCLICGYESDFDHEYDSEWLTNDTYHYHECIYCQYEGVLANHTLTYTEIDSTYHQEECDVCHYEKEKEQHTLDYVTRDESHHYQKCEMDCGYQSNDESHTYEWKYDHEGTQHWKECDECHQTTSQGEHTYGDYEIIDGSGTKYNSSGQPLYTIEYSCLEECGYSYQEDVISIGFAHDTWETINNFSTSDTAKEYYHVGDTKEIYLTTDEKIEIRILGFDHDSLTDGSGTAGMTIGMTNCLATRYEMNGSETNSGGWRDSRLRLRLNPKGSSTSSYAGSIYNTLPSDLTTYIKPVDKKGNRGGGSTSTPYTTSDHLFLLAPAEVWSESAIKSTSNDRLSSYPSLYISEGSQYEYYRDTISNQNPNNACSLLVKEYGESEKTNWYLRSPYTGNSKGFIGVDTSGACISITSDNTRGISFAFCV